MVTTAVVDLPAAVAVTIDIPTETALSTPPAAVTFAADE
jgi:hypothetical protein